MAETTGQQHLFSGIYRIIAYVNGLFCLYVAVAMLAPMTVDLIDNNDDWRGFLAAFFLVGSVSLMLILANRGGFEPFTLRLGFLLVASLWITTSLVSSLPFIFGARHISFTDSIFEAVSGLTTTGATVLTGLDDMPRGLLLWRSVTQWLGGIGIVAMSLLLLPFLRIGGMQFFRMETSDRADKPVARMQSYAVLLLTVYLLLTVSCMVLYAANGMTWFNALNHAMTTVSTAGFSTHDSSFGQYGNGVLLTGIAFMIIGALPFALIFIHIVNGTLRSYRDSQIFAFLGIVAVLAIPVYIASHRTGAFTSTDAFVHALFNLVSVITTTGYASADYVTWGSGAIGVFLIATFIGGCAGSTSGGLKIYRFIILAQGVRTGIRELVYPNGVFPMYYNGQRVSLEGYKSVATFFFAYLVILFVATPLLAITGMDFDTALSGAVACLSNVGPGITERIGPAGNFADLDDVAKWILTVLMLLGRLEIMTLLVIFSPVFWRGQ